MRDFLLRFPHLGQSIFEIVGDVNLIKCKTVSRSWSTYMDEERFFWKQIIKKLVHDYDDFQKDWNVAMKKSDIEMLKELGCAVKKFLSVHPTQCFDEEKCKHRTIPFSPLHLCAETGLVSLCKFLLPISEDKNPKNKADDGWTPIHEAAQEGHLEVYKELVNHLKDEDTMNYISKVNLPEYRGFTPLHAAAKQGHLNVCQEIMELLDDKNPRSHVGYTPLHIAAQHGYVDICRYIMSQIIDKFPRNEFGFTPLHDAAQNGHFDVCKYILDQTSDKNPRSPNGNTPLHLAALHGHSMVFGYIMRQVDNKNPPNELGYTPLHWAAEFDHIDTCKLIFDKVKNKSPISNDGKTPLDLARDNNCVEIIQLLKPKLDYS